MTISENRIKQLYLPPEYNHLVNERLVEVLNRLFERGNIEIPESHIKLYPTERTIEITYFEYLRRMGREEGEILK